MTCSPRALSATGTPLKKSVVPSVRSGQGGTGLVRTPGSATHRSRTPAWSRGSVGHTSMGLRIRLWARMCFLSAIISTGTPSGSCSWACHPFPDRVDGCTHRGFQPSLRAAFSGAMPSLPRARMMAFSSGTTSRSSPSTGSAHVGAVRWLRPTDQAPMSSRIGSEYSSGSKMTEARKAIQPTASTTAFSGVSPSWRSCRYQASRTPRASRAPAVPPRAEAIALGRLRTSWSRSMRRLWRGAREAEEGGGDRLGQVEDELEQVHAPLVAGEPVGLGALFPLLDHVLVPGRLGDAHHPLVCGRGAGLPGASGEDAGAAPRVGGMPDGDPVGAVLANVDEDPAQLVDA